MVGRVGFEPTAIRLKVECSTPELPAHTGGRASRPRKSSREASGGLVGRTHAQDLVGVLYSTARSGATLDRVDMLHALDHFAGNGVLAVEAGRRCEHDEELAVGSVRAGSPRHAERAAH